MAASVNGELPVDSDTLEATVGYDGQQLSSQLLDGRNTTIEAETRQGGKLDLDHVQPTGRFRCEKELEPLGEGESLIGGQVLIEGTEVMSVQIIQHDPNPGRGGVSCGQCLEEQGELSFGALGLNLGQSVACQRFNRRQQGTGTMFGVSIMLFAHLSAVHGPRVNDITNEKARAFIEAHHWVERVVRQRIQPQNALHLGDEAAG